MTLDEFWELNKGLPIDGAEEVLEKRISELAPVELEAFVGHFDSLFTAAYQWQLWAAAYIMEGGCSDDGFIDFRYGLISRGREVFLNPRSLILIRWQTWNPRPTICPFPMKYLGMLHFSFLNRRLEKKWRVP